MPHDKFLERTVVIETTWLTWKVRALPLSYARIYIINIIVSLYRLKINLLVEPIRIELMTSCLQSMRSPI